MKKMYMIASHLTSDGTPVGVVCECAMPDWMIPSDQYDTLLNLVDEEREEVVNKLREYGISKEKLDSYDLGDEDGELQDPVLFHKRKDARDLCDRLNKMHGYTWRVVEVGDPAPRDMRPVLGWRIIYNGHTISGFNDDAARVCPDNMVHLEDGEPAFKTRQQVREFFKKRDLGQFDDYTIEPVYGAWRVDYPSEGGHRPGGLRFRTKREAEDFASSTYGTKGRVVLHDQPVNEDELYTPVVYE